MTDENEQYLGRGHILDRAGGRDRLRPGNNDEQFARSAQPAPTRSCLSADAPEFIPRSALNMPADAAYVSQQANPQVNGEGDMSNNVSLDQVRTIIYEMSVDPGEFDTLALYLTDALNASITDENTLIAVVNEIFEQSLVDSNLRYNGSRLCNYLSNKLVVIFGPQNFRKILLKRFEHEFNQRTTYAVQNRPRLREFAMLMGELFIHLEITNNGTTTKVTLLGSSLPTLLDTILKHSSPEDVKCVCQILKFTGAAMEDLLGGELKELDDLFEVMKALASQEHIERTSKDMLTNVIKLRESNWGRGTPTHSSSESINYSQLPAAPNEPIFYGPDGQPLSSEEARFLESDKYLYSDHPEEDYNEYSQNPNLWSNADGMDDEMAEDYEKFLMENS